MIGRKVQPAMIWLLKIYCSWSLHIRKQPLQIVITWFLIWSDQLK